MSSERSGRSAPHEGHLNIVGSRFNSVPQFKHFIYRSPFGILLLAAASHRSMYLFGYEPFDDAAFFNGFERKSCPECGSAEILRQCKDAVSIQRCFPLGCAGRSSRSLEQSSRAASGYTSPSWSWATRVSRKYLLWSVLSPLSSANMDSSRTRMPLNTKVAGDKPPALGGSPFGPPMNVYHAVEVLRSN